ncbi:MAG: 2-oxoacid:acceptor oxidoreductase subunit alpha [Spirochaetales bacterium]|nr:2-oxoacid:acceptor oxidoreductase subunit alpha [Spirochaetales bacterium]
MKEELTIRIAGEAGQGLATIGSSLCIIVKKAGFNLFANQDYMSRIRGGNNFFQIRISAKPVSAIKEKIDILIPLDKESIGLHKKDCSDDSLILADVKHYGIEKPDDSIIDIPFFEISSGNNTYINTAAIGCLGGMMDIDFVLIENVLKTAFEKKGETIVQKNIHIAKTGYEYGKKLQKAGDIRIKPSTAKEELLLNGNEAIALGAMKAGMKFYCAYPMTPSTSIMNTIAHFAHDYGILVEQAEDEIAAVNMAIGASAAGVRSMTGTSGGGFALMQEGISLAGMTETPVVIVDSQRPGPATGFPTRTEQGDLNFVIHAGHGDFAKAVFCPGTIEECFSLTIKAFHIADKYQIPVIIMTDQHLADSIRNTPVFDHEKISIQSYRIPKNESLSIKDYKRYRLTDNGISPRAVFSWIDDVIYTDSDEHTEEGHITESEETRNVMVEKRFFKRYKELEKEIIPPSYFNTENADILFLGFGSTHNVLKEVCESLKEENTGYIHLSQVWPFPKDQLIPLIKDKRIYTVENNAGAQLAGLISRETGIKPEGSILKYDGRPFSVDLLKREIMRRIK